MYKSFAFFHYMLLLVVNARETIRRVDINLPVISEWRARETNNRRVRKSIERKKQYTIFPPTCAGWLDTVFAQPRTFEQIFSLEAHSNCSYIHLLYDGNFFSFFYFISCKFMQNTYHTNCQKLKSKIIEQLLLQAFKK